MPAQTITIIGAGMAGLTAALSFSARGFEVDIVEQAPALSEVGAGLQISPNASRILIRLGLGDAMRQAMTCPDEISLVSGASLRKITHVPGGSFAETRWGAPYGVMHRADLQALLLDAVRADPRCRLHLDTRVEAGDLAGLQERLGGTAPLLTVGADGVWSQIRTRVPGALPPRFSGQVAWRFRMPAEATRAILNARTVTAFLGPQTHLVAYPLEGGASVNMVAIARGQDPGQTWAAREKPADRLDLIHAFSGWHRDILAILRAAPEMTWWPLFEVPDGSWHSANGTVLIGDAAHAMTPFAAQGAAMAIEDAFELAAAVSSVAGGTPEAMAQALAGYERQRRARIGRARNRAAFNQFAYHARGPIRIGRDIVLALRSPETLAADLDWLYGYRASGL